VRAGRYASRAPPREAQSAAQIGDVLFYFRFLFGSEKHRPDGFRGGRQKLGIHSLQIIPQNSASVTAPRNTSQPRVLFNRVQKVKI
jgi:hypothetical protein